LASNVSKSSIEEFIFSFVDFIWEVDKNGIYTYVAGNIEEIIGYSADEILGKSPFDLMPEQEAKKVSAIFLEILKNQGDIVDLVNWNIHKNGTEVCLLTNGKAFYSKEGVFLGYRGIDKDITQKYLSESHMKNQLKSLIEWSSSNVQGTLETIKEALEISAKGLDFHRVSFWKYKADEECIECTDMYEAESRIHSEGLQLFQKDFPHYFLALQEKIPLCVSDARSDSRTSEFTESYLVPNKIYSVLDVPVFWKGDFLGVVCHEYKYELKNITEQDLEFALAISESISKAIDAEQTKILKDTLFQKRDELSLVNRNLQLALDAVDAGTFIFDIKNNRIEWDENSLNLFGVDKKTFQQNYLSWMNLISNEDRLSIENMLDAQLKCSEVIDIRYKVHNKNSSFKYVWTIGSIIRDKKRRPIYISGLSFDETTKVKLDATVEEMKNRAITASNAKSDFLSSMSHEIRTPLNAILGFTRLSQKEKSLSVDVQKNLQIIENSSEHLLDIINQVLDMSKIEAGKLELKEKPFNLHTLIESVSEMIKIPINEKGLEYICDFDLKDKHLLQSDESKIKQVLINILGNAVKFTKEGYIRLSVIVQEEAEETIKLDFVVEDSGRGIVKEKLNLIFEPFTQAEIMDQDQGSGLGLNISQKIVHLLGGEIYVKSELNKGTQFRVSLALKRAESIEKELEYKKVKSLVPEDFNRKILVVDDIMVNRLLLKTFLEEVGFSVVEANDGEHAIEVALKENPEFIWMDLKMPIMDGGTATKILKEKEKLKAPIVALSANAIDINKEETLFDDFLTKPFDEKKMFDLIRQYIGVEYIYLD